MPAITLLDVLKSIRDGHAVSLAEPLTLLLTEKEDLDTIITSLELRETNRKQQNKRRDDEELQHAVRLAQQLEEDANRAWFLQQNSATLRKIREQLEQTRH